MSNLASSQRGFCYITVAAFLGSVIMGGCVDKPNAHIDYGLANRYLVVLVGAEMRFASLNGRYGSLSHVLLNRDDPTETSIASGTYDGFGFDLVLTKTGFAAVVRPKDNRVVSLYTDETCQLRIAFRGEIATSTSRLIGKVEGCDPNILPGQPIDR